MPRRDPAKAVQVLDLLLGFFGDHGEHWLQHRLGDGTGKRCLVGALGYIRRHQRFKGDGAGYYMADAIPRRIAALIEFSNAIAIKEKIKRSMSMLTVMWSTQSARPASVSRRRQACARIALTLPCALRDAPRLRR
jgi:hypothetical protein